MTHKFASICLLSYQRLPFLKRTLDSLFSVDAGYDFELIISDDGSDPEVKDYLYGLLKEGKISYLILNGGKNRGIGCAIRNCFKVASGDYLFKMDTDLEYSENWLKMAVECLADGVDCVSLFNYRHYDPNDERFQTLADKGRYLVVNDLVSSIYGVRRETYEKYKDALGTDGWHLHIRDNGGTLGITAVDYVSNFGFGADTSIYLEKTDTGVKVRETHDLPLIF